MRLVLGDLVELFDFHHRKQAKQFLADPEQNRVGLGRRGLVPERDAHAQPHGRHESDGREIHDQMIETLTHLFKIGKNLLLNNRSLPLADVGTCRFDEQNAFTTRNFNETGGVAIGKRATHSRNHSEGLGRISNVGPNGGWAVYPPDAGP